MTGEQNNHGKPIKGFSLCQLKSSTQALLLLAQEESNFAFLVLMVTARHSRNAMYSVPVRQMNAGRWYKSPLQPLTPSLHHTFVASLSGKVPLREGRQPTVLCTPYKVPQSSTSRLDPPTKLVRRDPSKHHHPNPNRRKIALRIYIDAALAFRAVLRSPIPLDSAVGARTRSRMAVAVLLLLASPGAHHVAPQWPDRLAASCTASYQQ